jgi:uncharacterized Zn finger protein
MSFYSWRPYVSVAARRAKARKEMDKLRKKGKDIQPVELASQKIAATFWGKGWCIHLESFNDYDNRLPRGRTYVRNGSVCHLEVKAGRIEAFVSGSELYKIAIAVKPLAPKAWKAIKEKCQGQIGSVLELLQGRLSDHVMEVVSDRTHGLFPQPGEIELKCSCPDWAVMCKHVAAVLYGVGSRLDHRPELLFLLRGVDAQELISADMALSAGDAIPATEAIGEGALAEIFGVDLDMGSASAAETKALRKTKKTPAVEAKRKGKAATPPETAAKDKRTRMKAVQKQPEPVFDPKAPSGESIAKLRKLTGLTVPDFARALGVSAQSVQRWETIPGPVRLYSRPLAALTQLQGEYRGK